MTDPTNADRALAQSADQELAQLLASAHLNWICGREVTKDNAGEMFCLRLTMDDMLRIIDALASREAAGHRRGQEEMRERCGELLNKIGWQERNIYAVVGLIRALPITGADNAE